SYMLKPIILSYLQKVKYLMWLHNLVENVKKTLTKNLCVYALGLLITGGASIHLPSPIDSSHDYFELWTAPG
ncbi:MAG: hypothetical protein ACYDHG_12410, partial [Desulfomonilaceae bacterium]